jgi:cation:H+ antiporter
MEPFAYIALFIGCCWLLYLSGEWVVNGLIRISRYLGWREFVVSFFVMACAASLPNLFVGITSALKGVPELSFGDVMGNNLVAITLAVAFGVLFSLKREIRTDGIIIQRTALLMVAATTLPFILAADGMLSRIDGLILFTFFIASAAWLFSKEGHFTKVYGAISHDHLHHFMRFLKDAAKIAAGIIFLLFAAYGIVSSAAYFGNLLGISLILIGVFVTGFGNALPEVYFAISSARKGEAPLILGNIMGSVIIPSTAVLGAVAIIHPIAVSELGILGLSRVFIIVAAFLFIVFVRSKNRVSTREAYILILLYLLFIISAALFTQTSVF